MLKCALAMLELTLALSTNRPENWLVIMVIAPLFQLELRWDKERIASFSSIVPGFPQKVTPILILFISLLACFPNEENTSHPFDIL